MAFSFLDDLEYVINERTINGTDYTGGSFTLDAPAGKQAIAGGYEIGVPGALVTNSSPVLNNNDVAVAWSFIFTKPVDSTGTIVFYVTCVAASPSTAVRSTSQDGS